MKKGEVPQDRSNLESSKFKELCYAVDEDGQYTTAKSTGWTPKTIALDNAIEVINERTEHAKQRVLNNTTSPIEYYMELHKMDLPILASYVGGVLKDILNLKFLTNYPTRCFKNMLTFLILVSIN
jgi:hypothetical protein